MTGLRPYTQLGELALDVVVRRFVQAHSAGQAESFARYFAEKRNLFVRLSWGVAKRVEKNGQGMDRIARESLTALRDALLEKIPPSQAGVYADWFAKNDVFLLSGQYRSADSA